MQIEKKRLENKGWGNFLTGLFILITMVTGTYYYGKPIWIENVPENLEDKKTFFVLGSLAVHILT